MHITSIRLIIIVVVFLFLAAGVVFAQSVLTDLRGVAVKGYDVVAYFTLGEPTRGNREFQAEYQGATYYFANAEHRRLFLENPEQYVPQYGGYCAYAVSQGSTATIKPHLWTIHDGRLFLNFNNRTNRLFLEDLENMVERADENWPEIRRGLE